MLPPPSTPPRLAQKSVVGVAPYTYFHSLLICDVAFVPTVFLLLLPSTHLPTCLPPRPLHCSTPPRHHRSAAPVPVQLLSSECHVTSTSASRNLPPAQRQTRRRPVQSLRPPERPHPHRRRYVAQRSSVYRSAAGSRARLQVNIMRVSAAVMPPASSRDQGRPPGRPGQRLLPRQQDGSAGLQARAVTAFPPRPSTSQHRSQHVRCARAAAAGAAAQDRRRRRRVRHTGKGV